MTKPKPPVKLVSVRWQANKHAVYLEGVFEDANGARWRGATGGSLLLSLERDEGARNGYQALKVVEADDE